MEYVNTLTNLMCFYTVRGTQPGAGVMVGFSLLLHWYSPIAVAYACLSGKVSTFKAETENRAGNGAEKQQQ